MKSHAVGHESVCISATVRDCSSRNLYQSFLYAFFWGTSLCLQWQGVYDNKMSKGQESTVIDFNLCKVQ